MKYFNNYFLVRGNYHRFIHVLINLSSLYQSLVQLLEHDCAFSCPLNSNLLNILLLGGERAGEEWVGGGGPVGWAMGLKFFFKPGSLKTPSSFVEIN